MSAEASPYLHQIGVNHVEFVSPVKRINTGDDLSYFLTSTAYRDLKIWIVQLARACLPRRLEDGSIKLHQLDEAIEYSHAVEAIRSLLAAFAALIDQAPPDTGPRRFGNVAFRKWASLLSDHIDDLLTRFLEPLIPAQHHSILVELKAYLLESFGSPQRLDNGTGHELNFLAFVGGLWKLGVFEEDEQWQIVAGILEPYLSLVRTLIKTYNLEPAGSHGVWGLDDHSFVPYILGSAQFATPLSAGTSAVPFPPMPMEGSVASAPEPSSIMSIPTVNEQRTKNFYFAAIGFILDVKKGPFFEHSPYLYNISGIKQGWGKINKGMLKMYDAEVLGKFPVVQHFPFGKLWQWETDPQAVQMPTANVHVENQPNAQPGEQAATRAPWASTPASASSGLPSTRAPWASTSSSRGMMPPPRAQRDTR